MPDCWAGANAFPTPAIARRRRRPLPPSWPCGMRSRPGSTGRRCMPPGAARNAVDCALVDLEAKREGRRAWEVLGRQAPRPCTTAYTISLGSPQAMAAATARAEHRPLLKIKLGGDGDPERIAAVRRAAPDTELIVDANEAWTPDNLASNLAACAAAGVTLVEQPL